GGGTVEKKKQTTDLEKLGGLAKIMPITFVTFLIASLAISGVPPFNGFASKWMIYQGIIKTAQTNSYLWVIWLTAAMFGSALTLASFMKLIHSIFLGQTCGGNTGPKLQESTPLMWVPQIILALLCIIFGVFAYRVPLRTFILPSLRQDVAFYGIWNTNLATILIITGIIIGVIIYFLGTITKTRKTDVFVGGEILKEHPDMRVSGAEFYNTIQNIGFFKTMYLLAEKKIFDVYEMGAKITFGVTAVLRFVHNGILPTYLSWCLLGTGILFYILLK
ncbi:MAG: hypothetical protein JSV34_03770, partial [Candidatus Omnitrophota bacterium]